MPVSYINLFEVNMKTVVLTGGGTAGHVIPLIALLPELEKRFDKIYFIGGCGPEKELAKKAGLTYFQTQTIALKRSFSPKNLAIPFILEKGVCQAEAHLENVNPSVVIGKGGYASLPTMLAAKRLGVPSVAHESDLTVGLANKIACKFGGALLLTSFPETKGFGRTVYTGFPLRESLSEGNKFQAAKSLDLNLDKPVLLVMGGSSGAEAINKAVALALDKLLAQFNVVHIVGKRNPLPPLRQNYRPLSYSDDVQNLYALADVVVSRAGAGAVSELSYLKKSVVLIPLPSKASRGDQLDNARYAQSFGAVVLEQQNLTPDTLLSAVCQARNVKMRPLSTPANKIIADILVSEANGNGKKIF